MLLHFHFRRQVNGAARSYGTGHTDMDLFYCLNVETNSVNVLVCSGKE